MLTEHFTTIHFMITEKLRTSKSKPLYFQFEKIFPNISQKVDKKNAWFLVSTKPQNRFLK